MIKPGEEWGRPASAPAELEIAGGDTDLAAAVAGRPGILVRFRPDPTSDLAGAVGLEPGRSGPEAGAGMAPDTGIEVDLDLLRLDDDPAGASTTTGAVNMVVVGRPPDTLGPWVRCFGANVRIDGRPVFHGPCTTVVVASGQFLRGLDVVPRGHPGDGRAEVQIYAVSRRQRRALTARLATGTHVPHPDITQRSGRRITISLDRRVAVEVDGRPAPEADEVGVTVVPAAYRLLL